MGILKPRSCVKIEKNESIDPQYVCHNCRWYKTSLDCNHMFSVRIMAKNEIEASVTYSFLCGVRGFQVYKEVWKPILRECLNFSHGRKNLHDRYAIAAYKRLPGRLADSINGHLPRKISRPTLVCVCFFLRGEVAFFPLLALCFRCDLQIGYIYCIS